MDSAPSKKNVPLPMVIGAAVAGIALILAVVLVINLRKEPASEISSQPEQHLNAGEIEQDTGAESSVELAAAQVETVMTEVPDKPAEQDVTVEEAGSSSDMDNSTSESYVSITSLDNNILFETFDDNTTGWFTGSDETGSKGIANGNYVWDVQFGNDGGSDAWQLLSEDLVISDFNLKVDARRMGSTPGDLCYGVIFRAVDKELSGIVSGDDGEYYELEVCDNQYYLITYFDGDGWVDWQEWAESDAIRPDDWNTLEVQAAGDQFKYFINGEQVFEYSDSTLAEGNIGLAAYAYDGAQGEILFDNFQMQVGPNALSASDAEQLFEYTDVKGFFELANEVYSEEELDVIFEADEPIYLELYESIPLRVGNGWCAIDQETLEENLANIEFAFVLNGQQIPESNMVQYEYSSDDGWACATIYSIIDNWTSGEHIVSQDMNVLSTINDGENEYQPGLLAWLDFIVTLP
jgi:hypothetical protein